MRAAGSILPLDGGGGGGIGTVTSVNGVAPVLGDVSLAATDIPSTGPSTVQGDIDLLGGSVTTTIKAIESWDDFTDLPGVVEGPAGTWTFSQPLTGAGTIILPIGTKIAALAGAGIHAIGLGALVLVADVDAPAISGAVEATNVIIVQNNTGPNSACLEVSSSAPSTPLVANCRLIGGRVGLRIANVDVVGVRGNLAVNNEIGYEVSGTNTTVLLQHNAAISNAPSFVGFVLDPGATLTSSLGIYNQATTLAPSGQYAFALAQGATLGAGVLIQIAGPANTGPQDAVRQFVAGITAVSVNSGGTYTGADGDYPATQASTSGSGTDAEFTVTLASGAVAGVALIDEGGTNYAVPDTITLTVIGPTETVAAVLNVDSEATDRPIDDDSIVIKGGPSVSNWVAVAVASRFDIGDPLIVDTSTAGAGVEVIIPYEDGAGNLEITAAIESHFVLFKNGADPLDWYVEYTGTLSNVTMRVAVDVLADRASAGPSTALVRWKRSPFLEPGHGAFATIQDSDLPWSNTNDVTSRSGIATVVGVNPHDRFKPVAVDSTGVDIRFGELRLDFQIGS